MYHLFQRTIRSALGSSMLFPEFRHAQLGMQRSVQQVIEYHRQNPHSLNASHFLVKLLQSIAVNWNVPDDVYNDKVEDMALNLAMSLKMTSALSRGQVFSPGVFFGPNIQEILIATIDPYDTSELGDHWRDLQPIRILYHPATNLYPYLLDGDKDPGEEGGYAVITVNIPMLASQYRQWRKYDARVSKDAPHTTMQFLTMYPIPNMAASYVDWSIANRLIHRFFDLPLGTFRNPNPFYLTDYSAEVDKTLAHYLTQVETKGWAFDSMLNAIPQLTTNSFQQLIQPPSMAYTVQLQWAIAMARLPLIAFLVQLNYATDNQRNQVDLTQIKQWLRRFDLNRTLRALPSTMYEDVLVLLERGILPYLA